MLKMKRKRMGSTIVNSKVIKIQKKDKVIVLTGKDRGTISNVMDIKKGGDYVKVEGLRMETHFKKDDGANKGGIETSEGWIHISNVSHVTGDGKPTKVKIVRENGQKLIYSRKTNEALRTTEKSIDQKVKVEDQALRKEKADLKKEKFQEEKKEKEAGVISKKTDMAKKKKGN